MSDSGVATLFKVCVVLQSPPVVAKSLPSFQLLKNVQFGQ